MLDRTQVERRERTRPLLDRAWKVRLARGAVLLVLLVGAASGPFALASSLTRTAGKAAGQTSSGSAGQAQALTVAGAQGFAELFVAAWLNQSDEQNQDALAAFYPGAANLSGTRSGQFYAARTATVAAELVSAGYWSLTVAADVLRRDGSNGTLRPAGTHYYMVGVRVRNDQCVATSLPAEVAAPRTAPLPGLSGGDLRPPLAGDPVVDTLNHFFAALLTGQGQLSRYVTGESGIDPVSVAPFAAVTLQGMTDPTELAGHAGGDADAAARLVRAEVAAADAAGNTTVLDYALEVTKRNDLWVVSRLLGAPPLEGAVTTRARASGDTG